MSNQGSNFKQTSLKLEKLELTGSIPLEIPGDVADKIKYLCKNIPKDEWSGVLFYEVSGSIRNTGTMKVILKDIYLMDKGTSGYTEFNWDESIIGYRIDHPETMNWCIGHIHSHNTMGVFFSGTDWEELNDNCVNHNFYLSVIVNNYFDVKAKIAFTAEPKAYICKDETGKDYSLKLAKGSMTPLMFIYDCDFAKEEADINVPDEFNSRMSIVVKESDQRRVQAAEDKKNREKNNSKTSDWLMNKTKDKSHEIGYGFGQNIIEDSVIEDDTVTIEEEFTIYLIRYGNEIDDDTLMDALDSLETSGISGESLATSILESYGAHYDRFFEKINKFHGDEPFLNTLEKVIACLEEWDTTFEFLVPLIAQLKSMGNKFETFSKEKINQSVWQ